MKNLTLSIVVIFLVGFIFQGCSPSGKLSTKNALLRLSPKPNTNYDQNMTINTKIDGLPGANMDMNMTLKNDFLVESVDADGNFVFTTKVVNVTAKMENPMFNVDYNSDNPNLEDQAEAEFHKSIKDLINVPFVSKVSKLGKTIDAPKPKSKDANISEKQLQSINQGQSSFINFPEKAVKVGDQWTSVNDIEGEMPMTVTTTYTTKAITLTTVTLGLDGKLKVKEGGMGSGSGILVGEATIDRITGMIQKQNLTQKVNLSVMGMDMKSTTVIDLVMTKK
ncbi:MAG TPA: hypothetical protein ENK85_10050 [Saprospiraceae bacterium]|nr:hypothetical protein [Saprospiraceae bacterium]